MNQPLNLDKSRASETYDPNGLSGTKLSTSSSPDGTGAPVVLPTLGSATLMPPNGMPASQRVRMISQASDAVDSALSTIVKETRSPLTKDIQSRDLRVIASAAGVDTNPIYRGDRRGAIELIGDYAPVMAVTRALKAIRAERANRLMHRGFTEMGPLFSSGDNLFVIINGWPTVAYGVPGTNGTFSSIRLGNLIVGKGPDALEVAAGIQNGAK